MNAGDDQVERDALPELPAPFSWGAPGGFPMIVARSGSARAAFTTRNGGVSTGPYESLNLGLQTGDDHDLVIENRRILCDAIGFGGEEVVIGRQVHGRDLLEHRSAAPRQSFLDREADPPDVDGHVLRSPGTAALVFVADCLPIVLEGDSGVAVVHGGWRGLAAEVLEHAVERVGARSALIGPGIGSCCYEVGDEVLRSFARHPEAIIDDRMLDLTVVAETTLRARGVVEVAAVGLCTRCNPGLFFSHRGAGPSTGRQSGVGWIDA